MDGFFGVGKDVVGGDHHDLWGDAHVVANGDFAVFAVADEDGVGLDGAVVADGDIALHDRAGADGGVFADG